MSTVTAQGSHHLAHPFQHPTSVGAGFTANIANWGTPGDRVHNRLGSTCHIRLDGTFFPTHGDMPRRDHPRFHIAFRSFQHHRRTVADKRSRHGHNHPCLFRGERKPGGDAIGIRQQRNHLPGRRHFYRRQHAFGYLVDKRHFINNRQGTLQAIIDQHTIILLEDHRHHVDAPRERLIQLPGGIHKIDLMVHQRYPSTAVFFGRQRVQIFQTDRGSNAQSLTARRLGVMTNHRRFGDNRFGNGLHRHIANDRRGLIQANERHILLTAPGFIQRLHE